MVLPPANHIPWLVMNFGSEIRTCRHHVGNGRQFSYRAAPAVSPQQATGFRPRFSGNSSRHSKRSIAVGMNFSTHVVRVCDTLTETAENGHLGDSQTRGGRTPRQSCCLPLRAWRGTRLKFSIALKLQRSDTHRARIILIHDIARQPWGAPSIRLLKP